MRSPGRRCAHAAPRRMYQSALMPRAPTLPSTDESRVPRGRSAASPATGRAAGIRVSAWCRRALPPSRRSASSPTELEDDSAPGHSRVRSRLSPVCTCARERRVHLRRLARDRGLALLCSSSVILKRSRRLQRGSGHGPNCQPSRRLCNGNKCQSRIMHGASSSDQFTSSSELLIRRSIPRRSVAR